ncbi:flagellar FlbD family protein [Anaerosporobacter sp.]
MIEVTRLNGVKFSVNCDLIETVEETPDTVITLTNGKKFVVSEKMEQIRNLVIDFKRQTYCDRI